MKLENNPTTSFHDDYFTRYRLVKSNAAKNSYNWLFLPGGPGADSCYFLSLINKLDAPGNFWLIDFPVNGNNKQTTETNYDFDQWENCLLPAVQRFENPLLVGHSFGGMFPLLFPDLEKILKGFILLNAAPKLWLNEAANYAKENNVSTLSEAGKKFRENPTEETFRAALLANAHCHFPPMSINTGKKMFEQIPFNYRAMLWWIKKAQEINFDAQWIPQDVPTLIMGGTQDFIVPCRVFEVDKRFHRQNIKIETLKNAGHFLWIEQMAMVKSLFNAFFEGLQSGAHLRTLPPPPKEELSY